MEKQLPKRVFNSPLVAFTNFADGSYINLIKLNQPYANGDSYAIYQTTRNPDCTSGLYKDFETAKKQFGDMVDSAGKTSPVVETGWLNKDKPFTSEEPEVWVIIAKEPNVAIWPGSRKTLVSFASAPLWKDFENLMKGNEKLSTYTEATARYALNRYANKDYQLMHINEAQKLFDEYKGKRNWQC